MSWWRTALDRIPSLSLSLILSPFLQPSVFFSLSPFPSLSLRLFPSPAPACSPITPTAPALAPAAPFAGLWGGRLLPGVSAPRGALSRCFCGKRPALPCGPFHQQRLEYPPEKEPLWSPHDAPAASNPISAPEIITSATIARLFQPFRGAAATAGGTRRPGSPKLSVSQTDSRNTLGFGSGSGKWAASQGIDAPREEPSGNRGENFSELG